MHIVVAFFHFTTKNNKTIVHIGVAYFYLFQPKQITVAVSHQYGWTENSCTLIWTLIFITLIVITTGLVYFHSKLLSFFGDRSPRITTSLFYFDSKVLVVSGIVDCCCCIVDISEYSGKQILTGCFYVVWDSSRSRSFNTYTISIFLIEQLHSRNLAFSHWDSWHPWLKFLERHVSVINVAGILK